MIVIQKANKILRVEGDGKTLEDKYIARGFSILDPETGKVKRSPKGTAEQAVKDAAALRKQLAERDKRIAELEKTIAGQAKTIQEDAEQIAALKMVSTAETAKSRK